MMHIKENGKHSSVSNITKFYYAVKVELKISKRLMSAHFYAEVDKFIVCYKIKHAIMDRQIEWRLMPSAAFFPSC